jgi:hypothetical protein
MDIVERLREWKNSPLFNWADLDPSDMEEAADEIERLRETLAFYAEWGIDAPAVDAIIEEDCGDKARAALNIVLGEKE